MRAGGRIGGDPRGRWFYLSGITLGALAWSCRRAFAGGTASFLVAAATGARVVAGGLGTVAASGHRAPAAGAAGAGVDEPEHALGVVAASDAARRAGQQVGVVDGRQPARPT